MEEESTDTSGHMDQVYTVEIVGSIHWHRNGKNCGYYILSYFIF